VHPGKAPGAQQIFTHFFQQIIPSFFFKKAIELYPIPVQAIEFFSSLYPFSPLTKIHDDLDHLLGSWSEQEYDKIQSKIDKDRKIDRELWK
jgi:hypothetical protein